MVTQSEVLATHLKTRGYSVTKVRRAVFEALENSEPVSMRVLLDRLPAIDRASVYRTVALFEELGIIKRLQIGWKYKLELSDTFHYHHHHISCVNCGTIVPLREDTTIEAVITALSKEYGFAPTDHQLEIQGLCAQCQRKPRD